MQRTVFLFLALFCFDLSARAQEISPPASPAPMRPFLNGHNLTATSDLVPYKSCSVGITLIACGVSDNMSVGTSTWMIWDYNMASLALKTLLHEEANGGRWAFQIDYFKTYKKRNQSEEKPLSTYQMEAVWLMLIHTTEYAPHYRLHLNFHANYYFDEKMPFSLRRPYTSKTPYQFNLSALNQVDLIHGWFILGEVGLLDFARAPLRIHSGASIGRAAGNLSFHLGFSLTGSLIALFAPNQRADYQQNLMSDSIDGYNQEIDDYKVKYDYALHPEFSLSYMF